MLKEFKVLFNEREFQAYPAENGSRLRLIVKFRTPPTVKLVPDEMVDWAPPPEIVDYTPIWSVSLQ